MGNCAVLDALHGIFLLSLLASSRAYLIDVDGKHFRIVTTL